MLRQSKGMTAGAALSGVVLLLASSAAASQILGQSSGFLAPGRMEGAAPPMAIGVAASGVVSEVLAHEGTRVQAGQLLVGLDCRPLEADVRAREARLTAAQATYDRFRNGSRPDEIAVGDAVVGYSRARADEAQKILERTEELKEGVTVTAARLLQVEHDARIAAAQLKEALARLALLRAGSREEDIRDAKALRDAAAAELDSSRARLEQCSVRAPIDGTVLDVLVNKGQLLSEVAPQPLLHIVPAGQKRVRAEVDVRDLARLCAEQRATIAATSLPGSSIQAHVISMSPAVSQRSMAPAAGAVARTDAGFQHVVAVVLAVDQSTPGLPIGLPVTVHFDACPLKN